MCLVRVYHSTTVYIVLQPHGNEISIRKGQYAVVRADFVHVIIYGPFKIFTGAIKIIVKIPMMRMCLGRREIRNV